jgi:putative hydrolase of the HAD superfamily
MLLLIDLDNTLIDRASAFKAWAESRFGQTYGPSEVSWLVAADQDGYAPRPVLAARIADRYGLDVDKTVAELRAGMVDYLVFDPAVGEALTAAAAAGFVPYVVSNGTVEQQEAKLRRTGLDRLVAGWTISEGAGARKPDRRIFELAAAVAGVPLSGDGWMVGDNPELDVGGGDGVGLRTGWVSRGLRWPAELPYRPRVTGVDGASTLRRVIAATMPARNAGSAGPTS